jgi:mono/diheme cytochrome c family protein
MRIRSSIRFTAVVSLAIVTLLAVARDATGPRIRFEASTHDFGTLRSDQPTEYAWPFRNEGDAPLKILGTRPSCGCTATTLSDEPVPPGGTGHLRVTFDPVGMEGSIRKTLAVLSDDPERPRLLLTILAEVEAVAVEREAGTHPRIAGRSMLVGECASCHAAPAADRSGRALYDAVCAMCHGDDGTGTLAPSIREPSYLRSRSDQELHDALAYGTANPKMPGFSSLMGVRWTRTRSIPSSG